MAERVDIERLRARLDGETRVVEPRARPILFSAPMVLAILAGAKSQTRRLVKLPLKRGILDHTGWRPFAPLVAKDRADMARYSPYGEPGDRLWVKETWYDDFDRAPGEAHELNIDRFEDGRVDGIEYRASHDCTFWEAGCPCNPDGDGKRSAWRSSLFMPRVFSRITLEVTSVRVERLQSITPEDCRAEGIEVPRCDCEVCHRSSGICPADGSSYVEAYRDLWDSINGERASWASNPLVFVVGFKRMEASVA